MTPPRASRPAIRQAVLTLNAGGLIAYPTESVYGLGALPSDRTAVTRLLKLKQRSVRKGLILITDRYERVARYLRPLSLRDWGHIESSWPGPITWLLPVRPHTPFWLRGAHDTLAVRVTDHPLAAALCRAAGSAIVSTSANPSGLAPARDAREVARHFPRGIDYLLCGATGGRARPSEIRALDGTVVRPG